MQKSTTQKVEYSRFTFAENTTSNHQTSWEPGFRGVMDSLVLLAYASLAASGKVIFMNYGSSTCDWKLWRWVKLNLIFTMRDTYINSSLNLLTKFTSSRGTAFKVITGTVSINSIIVINYAVKRDITFLVWWKVNDNWGNHMIQISNGGKATVEQILA